jgi:hypothetical protein
MMVGLDTAAHVWVRYYRRREAEGFGPARPGARASNRTAVLRFIGAHSPAAVAALTAHDQPTASPRMRAIRQPDTGEIVHVPG